MPRLFPQVRAETLVKRLDLDLNAPLCYACLSVVSFALDRGDHREITRETRRITRDLWEEGLAEVARTAVQRACLRGVADACWALADLELNGWDSATARAITRQLAAELSRHTRTEMRLEELARERLSLAPPELN
jgi:hypothetical protein